MSNSNPLAGNPCLGRAFIAKVESWVYFWLCLLVKLGIALLLKLISPNLLRWRIFALRQCVGEIDPT